MANKRKTWFFPALAYCLTLTGALFWVALRINYSGISKFLGADTNPTFFVMNLPLMACGLAWLGFFITLAGIVMWKKRKWVCILGFCLGMVTLAGGAVVLCFGAVDYLRFIMYHFWRSMAVAAGLTALAVLLFFPIPGKSPRAMATKVSILLLAAVLAVVAGYRLRPFFMACSPVVYAVEDEYQIVFSTSDSAVAWVSIDGESYYDLFAGSSRSADRVHKVTVPQSVLDGAGGYTVCAQQMLYRGPFGGYKGKVVRESYVFRQVDAGDGLNYAALSDVHEAADAAARAVDREGLDFVVMLGDMVSMVETEADAQLVNVLAHRVTGGQIPVIYARGNHEIKGEYAEVLYKYVGSKDQSFAYTVTLGDGAVFAAVLDMGEDHEDDWWEYFGTAHFDLYRREQTQMLEQALAQGEYRNYQYRMVVCHIPIVFVDKDGRFESFRQKWTQLLNEMEMDICLSGHRHQVWMMVPGAQEPDQPLTLSQGYAGSTGKSAGGKVTDFSFPVFLVGQRSLEQTGGTQKLSATDYLCLHTRVDLAAGKQVSFYRNSRGETVRFYYPFASDSPLDDAPMTRLETELN